MRKEFGRHAKFTDESAGLLTDIRPSEAEFKEYIERNPCTTNVMVLPEFSESDCNTTQITMAVSGMKHVEGGWPKDIDPEEVEHVLRFQKKTEKDEDYIRAITNLGAQVEELIKQNNAIDIYEEYYDGAVMDHSAETPYAKTLTVFRDPHADKVTRSCSYISWYPDGARKLAIAYSIMEFQKQPEGMPTESYVWDVTNPNVPDFTMRTASQLCCVKYNEKDPNILIGGSYNGQVQFWDTRKNPTPVDATPIEFGHRDPVYDLDWLQSKTGTEALSLSTDGNVLFWDIRKLGEPTDTIPLVEKGTGVVQGAVSLEYESVAGPTKFMVGTESGSVIMCNRKAKNPQDRIGSSFYGHHGPVYALERNPFFPKYFMSIGDWTARIWMEDVRTPIVMSKYHDTFLTGGTWSPTRPGVFFTCKMDGTLDVWDYLYKQNDPTLSVQISDAGLCSFNLQDAGRLITTGGAEGNATLLELCEGLYSIQQNEKQVIAAMFDRETKRERNLEARAKELKLRQKRQAIKDKEEADAAAAANEGDAEEIKKIEAEFFEQTKGEDDTGSSLAAAPAPEDGADGEAAAEAGAEDAE